MLAEDLISDVVPALHPDDTGQKALNLMDVFRVSHLAVVDQDTLVGLVSDKFIYDLNFIDTPVGEHLSQLHTPHVHKDQHIFEIGAVMYKLKLSLVPVVDELHNYLGAITIFDLARKFASLFSLQEPGGIIMIDFNVNDYSLVQISQIVESNDAKIMSLFLNRIPGTSTIVLTIKLDKVDLSPIIQTLTRYDYTIRGIYMDQSMLNDLYNDRFEQFLKYMNI